MADDTTSSPRRRGVGPSTSASLATILVAVVLAALVAAAGSAGGMQQAGLGVFAWCAVLAFAINWVAFVPAYLARTERFYDLTGTISYLGVVGLALWAGTRADRSFLLAAMVTVWAVRLGGFLVVRIRRDGSDGRFDEIKVDPVRFAMSWTLQALWVVLTAGAALAAMTTSSDPGFGPLVVVGVVVWGIGFAIEVVADAQKRQFRADPANDGRFITSGLWSWSQHPNYFGEITLWVGVALVAAPALSGWQYVTLISPLFVTVLLTKVSGIPLLRARGRARWGDDPAYRSYVARTPELVLRPPRS